MMSALARSPSFSSIEEEDYEVVAKPVVIEGFDLKHADGVSRLTFKNTATQVDGKHVDLTGKEAGVLLFLVRNTGRVCSKEMILNHLYERDRGPELKIIDVFVCKLRKKLVGTNIEGCIETVWGRGYTIGESEAKPRLVEVAAESSKRVAGPNGLTIGLEDLPAPDTVRWMPSKKAILVFAVNGGLLSLDEVQQRYPTLSLEEVERWRTLAQHYGVKSLRTTRLQSYR